MYTCTNKNKKGTWKNSLLFKMSENNTVNISELIYDGYITVAYIMIDNNDNNNIIFNISDKTIIVNSDIIIKGFIYFDDSKKEFTSDHTLTIDTNLEIKDGGSLEIEKAKLVINKDSIINGTLKCVTLQV